MTSSRMPMPMPGRRWRSRVAAAAAVVVAAAGAIATTSAPATAASLVGNPLAGAAGFTVVSYGDAELSNHEVEGSIAVGGTVSVRTGQGPYNLIHKAAGNADYVLPVFDGEPVRLVVGGFDRASSTQSIRVASGGYTDAATQLGRMTIGSTTGVGIASRGSGVCVQAPSTTDCSGAVIEQSAAPQTLAWTVQPSAFDTLVTPAARARMAEWSAGISAGRVVGAAQATLGSTAQPMNGVDVTLVSGKVNVLDVAAADLPSTAWKLRFPGAKPSATTPLVINVVAPNGGSVVAPMETIGAYDAPGGSNDNNYARYMLWNIDQPAGSTVYISGDGIIPGSLLAPASHVITGLTGPADTSADKTLIEGQIVVASLQLRNSGEVHHYGYSATLEIGAAEQGGFSLVKALSGIAAADLPDGADTEFQVEYFLDGSTTAAGTITVSPDGSTVAGPQDLPLGTVVTFGEPTAATPGGRVWTGATFSPASVEITDDGQDTRVTVTNSYRAAVGGFRVAKALSGIAVADLPDGAATEFEVEYYLDGSATPAGALVVQADGTAVTGPTNLPLGTVVTFGEPTAVAPTGTVWTGATMSPSTVTITADGQRSLVTVTNSYRGAVGGFHVTKALAGIAAADLPQGTDTSFTVRYFLDGSVIPAGSLTVKADGVAVDGPQSLPYGTVVRFDEVSLPTMTGTWTPAFSPSSVTIGTDGQDTAVTVTNTYAPGAGGFSLAKALAGVSAADLPDGGDTEFEVEYFLDGSTTPAGTVTVTADGAVVAGPQNLPLGTVVTFDEVAPADVPGGEWAGATFAPATVLITADGQRSHVTLTNVFDVDEPTDGGGGDDGGGGGGGDDGGDDGGGGGGGGGDDGGGDDGGESGSSPREGDEGDETGAPDPGTLATTGDDVLPTFGVAVALMAAGGAVLLLIRRREVAAPSGGPRHASRRR